MTGYHSLIGVGAAVHVFNGWMDGGRMDGICLGVGGASALKGTYVLVGVFAWLCAVAC